MTFGDAHGHPGCHGCQMCFAEALRDELLAPGGPVPSADECPHPRVPVPVFDADAARDLSADEVRRRWPRGHECCPDCGAGVISYASPLHYISGDW